MGSIKADSDSPARRSFADVIHNEVTAWLVLAMSLLLTVAAWYIASLYVERRAQERFQSEVEESEFAIAKRMQEYELALWSGVALFNASASMVTREEWSAFVDTLDIDGYFPGLQGYGFALWTEPWERDAVEARVRTEGYPQFAIKPAGERAHYTPIIYLEPMDERNLRAFGYDMFSEPTRRVAMERSRDTGQAAVSGRVTLVQETEENIQSGFLMYLPVYDINAPHDTVEQRRAALLGFVYSPFRMDDLMQGILGRRTPALNFRIYDGERVDPDALLFDSQRAWAGAAAASPRQPAYSAQSELQLPGRGWTVQYFSRASFEQDMASNEPRFIAIGGLIVDVLLFAIIWSLAQQRNQVQVRVEQITAELRRSREHFRSITETALDAVITIDERGDIIYCNPAATGIFNVPEHELLGRPILTLLPDRREHPARHGLRHLLDPERDDPVRTTLESIGLRAGEGEFPLEASIADWRVEGRRNTTLLLRDITERKKVESLKSEFVATVSHELRTPLTAIRGALGLLHGMPSDAVAQQGANLISIANQNTERLVHLVNDILDLEKLEFGRLALDLQPVALPQLLQDAIRETEHYAKPHSVTLLLQHPVPEVELHADPNRLMQVLANLLSNATKFSPPAATVTLAASLQGDWLRVSVTDQGAGIPEDFRDRIFQRFSQADTSDSGRKGGSGLGLSISKSIIELHGGRIGYESGDNGGARFYFELPV